MESLILLAALALIVVVLLVSSIKIIPQARTANVERLGRYQRTAGAGLTVIIPFIDRMLPMVDMREQVVSFPPQPVITEDNLVVSIDTVVYFQVTDAKAATYEIANYIHAVEQLTTTTLRNVVGGMNLEEALTSRDAINSQLRGVLDEATGRWGLRVSRVELKAIDPPMSIQDSMEKQMRAERDRRAAILTAEGRKQAQILTAEGERQAQILSAEGDAQARVLRANAEAEAIEVVFDAIHSGGADSQVLAYQYLQSLPKIAEGESTTMFVVPAELTRALQGLGEAFGGSQDDDGARLSGRSATRGKAAGEKGRSERPARPTTADALRTSGVMDAMTAGAVTADELPQTSLDEALAVPEELQEPASEAGVPPTAAGQDRPSPTIVDRPAGE
ncbi:SPFH domain-containing protein [Micrococcus sp.]|uniref:SPFH domain-containing protein n=1 Tax=Micrococcus sp. TaxID=1271 RepID=UPI002A911418|nr:SPFH domain-containing protein [Micrococcus sp.]MDY6055413.1 SPFH domain-containing protein [Micrococcus sp.]